MRNIKIVLEYDGTNFCGWQKQKNGIGIQEIAERSLGKILNKKITLIGSGRTDSGVHARGQVASCRIDSSIKTPEIKKALNSYLPPEIRVKTVADVGVDFHARFSSKSKIYKYFIYNGAVVSPFISKYVWHFPCEIDYSVVKNEIKFLKGYHNFSCFQAKGTKIKDTFRRVYGVDFKKKGLLYEFKIEADGFLYKMVRLIVGTLIEVGRGKFEPGRIKALLKGGKIKRGSVAPGKGLFLWEVIYG